MRTEQAIELGKRIINNFRPTPALAEWVEVLEALDLDECLLTFRELRDTSDGGLTIGRFLGAYRGRIEARRRHDEAHRDPPRRCELCAGTGWVDAPPARAHRASVCTGTPRERRGDGGCWCTALDPCQCSSGVDASRLANRINDANRTPVRHRDDPELIGIGDPRAVAALTRGLTQGLADRDRLDPATPLPPAAQLPASNPAQLDLDQDTA